MTLHREGEHLSDDPLADAILENALLPKSVSVDGESVTNQSLPELIAAKKSIAADAAVNNANCGIVRRRNKFPGASGLHS